MLTLSIDGGGVRGILTAKLLARLDSLVPGWLEKVSLVAGASTGAVIALALAHGVSPVEIVNFYRTELPAIFKQSWWRSLTPLWRAKYDGVALRRALERIFGDTTTDQLKKEILIATYYLGDTDPFQRPRPRFYDRDDKVRVSDLALYSGAAPTYFPSVDRHIDGGVAANNCSVAAMAFWARKGQPLAEMKLLSLGTGRYPMPLEGGDVGLTYWGQRLLDPFVDGAADVGDFQAREFLGVFGGYHRLQPQLSDDVELDDVSRLDDLIDMADDVDLTATVAWLSRMVGSTNG